MSSNPPPSFPTGPPSYPPGVPDDDDELTPARDRRGRIVAAIAAALVLIVATIAYVSPGDSNRSTPASSGQDQSGTTQPSASTPSAPPITEPVAVPPVSDEELEAVVAELSAFVEAERQLTFLEPVAVTLLGDAAFRERLQSQFDDEDVAEIEDAEVFYRALGLLAGEGSLLDAVQAIYGAGVLGFYDPETDELVVRGGELTPYVRQTIVHELVHALDDQHFELDRPAYDDAVDEIGSGFQALVEGNASRVEDAWRAEQPPDVREAIAAEEDTFAEGMDLSGIPEILLFEIGAPYELGPILVDDILGRGGERRVDAALLDPPTTSEQVLFPDLYAEREPRVAVPAPPAGGSVVDEGVVGALFLLGLVTTGSSPVASVDAFRAVQGWGGDYAVTWRDGDVDCIRTDWVGDTASDTDEIESVLTAWADSRDGAVVARVDGRVRLQSCIQRVAVTPSQA